MTAENLPSPGPDCWIDPRVVVRDSSIDGRGLFARERIRRAEVVSRLGGRLVDTAELRRIFAASDEYVDTIAVANDVHLILPRRRPNGYGNHSCQPNLWWDGPFDLVARRDIESGEELTSDYATSTTDGDWAMRCHCGAEQCRGTIRGDDFSRFNLVDAYDGHVVPAVKEAAPATGEGGPIDEQAVPRHGAKAFVGALPGAVPGT